MNLRWTSAGLAALADAANTGTAKLRLTHLAIGDGQGAGGAGDDGRAALRSERHRAVIKGTDAAAGRIAFRADFAPDADYGITEAGVFGTAGDPPSKAALYLYWTDGGAKAGQAANGTALAIGATVDFQAAAADVTVTVGGKIEFGDPPDNATELKFGLTRYATAAETDGTSGQRAVTPKGLRAKFGALLARLIGKRASDGAIYQLKGKKDGTLGIEERTQDAATATALAGLRRSVQGNTNAINGKADSSDLPGAASATKKGIVELATDAEAKTGTDTERAVTPKALKAVTDALDVPAAPAAATTSKKGIVELATDAEAKAGTDTERAVTPKALKAVTDALDVPAAPAAATTSKKGIVELATDAEAKAGTDTERAVTPKALKAVTDALDVPAAPAAATTSKKGIVELATDAEAKAGTDTERAVTPKALKAVVAGKADSSDLPGDASTAQKGIVELATDAEAKTGTDTARAVTPKALKAAAAVHALAGVPAAGSAEKTYVIKRATSAKGGGLTFVEAVFRRYVTPGTHSFTVPAGVTRLRLLLVGAGGGGAGGYEDGYEDDHVGSSYELGYGGDGAAGGASAIRRGSITLASARGGAGGSAQGALIAADAGRRVRGAVYGAGGAGGRSRPNEAHARPPWPITASGGRAGALVERTVAVTPGESLGIVVGDGGNGGDAGLVGRTYTPDNYGLAGGSGSGGVVEMVNG